MANKASGVDRRIAKNSPRQGVPEEEHVEREMRGDREIKLTRALEMLLDGKTPQEVAKALGVSHVAVYQWLREPIVAKALQDVRSSVVESGRARLVLGLHDAITELQRVGRKSSKTDGPRVKALEIMVDRAGLYVERPDVRITVAAEVEMLTEEQLQAEITKLAGAKA